MPFMLFLSFLLPQREFSFRLKLFAFLPAVLFLFFLRFPLGLQCLLRLCSDCR